MSDEMTDLLVGRSHGLPRQIEHTIDHHGFNPAHAEIGLYGKRSNFVGSARGAQPPSVNAKQHAVYRGVGSSPSGFGSSTPDWDDPRSQVPLTGPAGSRMQEAMSYGDGWSAPPAPSHPGPPPVREPSGGWEPAESSWSGPSEYESTYDDAPEITPGLHVKAAANMAAMEGFSPELVEGAGAERMQIGSAPHLPLPVPQGPRHNAPGGSPLDAQTLERSIMARGRRPLNQRQERLPRNVEHEELENSAITTEEITDGLDRLVKRAQAPAHPLAGDDPTFADALDGLGRVYTAFDQWAGSDIMAISMDLQRAGVDVSEQGRFAILASRAVISQRLVRRDPFVLEKVALALAGLYPDFALVQMPPFEILAGAVWVIETLGAAPWVAQITGGVMQGQWSDEIVAYVAASAARDGMVFLPDFMEESFGPIHDQVLAAQIGADEVDAWRQLVQQEISSRALSELSHHQLNLLNRATAVGPRMLGNME